MSQMIRLPMLALVYGKEMFVKTVHGLQRIADQSVDELTSPGGAPQPPTQAPFEWPGPAALTSTGTLEPKVTEEVRKEKNMPDTNLNDDMLKLVRYKVLFLKRDYEYAFPEQEELVHDNITETAFTAWKIAEFIQRLQKTEVPYKWLDKNYPSARKERDVHGVKTIVIESLPEDDKKFLRVYFEVMQRYERDKFLYEERQVKASDKQAAELEKIHDLLERQLERNLPARK